MEGESLSFARSRDAARSAAAADLVQGLTDGSSTLSAYGLVWEVPWDFPRFRVGESHLAESTASTGPTQGSAVMVREGAVNWPHGDSLTAGPFRRADDSGCARLRIPGAATFAVQGLDVVVDNEVEGDATLRDLALAGPVASLVIRNAGMVPVRGAAVRDGEFAAVILGAPAVGVSTLAGALVARGLEFAGDDTLALVPRPGRLPLVACGGDSLQLPPDSEAALGPRLGLAGVPLRTATGLPRLDVHLDVRGDAPELAAIYVLDAEATGDVRMSPITGLARMEAIQAADWHRVLRREQGYDSDDFVAAAAVTTGVAMRQVSRIDGPQLHVGELSRVVQRDFRAVCRALLEAA